VLRRLLFLRDCCVERLGRALVIIAASGGVKPWSRANIRCPLKLHQIATRLRAVADGLLRLPNREAQDHAQEVLRLASEMLRSLEARREEVRGGFESENRRKAEGFFKPRRNEIAEV